MGNEENNNKIPKRSLKLSKKAYDKIKELDETYNLKHKAAILALVVSIGLFIVTIHYDEYEERMDKVEEDRVGTIINGKYVYQNEDIRNLYYVTVQYDDGNITTHIVKKLDAYDYFECNFVSYSTYLEHYTGSAFMTGEFSNYTSNSDAEICIDVIDETIISLLKAPNFPDASPLEILGEPNLSNDVKKTMFEDIVFDSRYGKIVSAVYLPHCLDFLGNSATSFTTTELFEIKLQMDNLKTNGQLDNSKAKINKLTK